VENKVRTELLLQTANIRTLCNEVLDDYNDKKLTLVEMDARMVVLSKKLTELSERLENEKFG
jgi:hypothetical protein